MILCGGDNRAWQGLRAALLEGGVIECDCVSEVGVKCYDYRLTAAWEERDISRYTPGDPGITGRLVEIYRKDCEHRLEPRAPVAEFLEDWVRRLRLDETEADRAIAGIEDPAARRCACSSPRSSGPGAHRRGM